jgi:osmotically-inducible protein OsmY
MIHTEFHNRPDAPGLGLESATPLHEPHVGGRSSRSIPCGNRALVEAIHRELRATGCASLRNVEVECHPRGVVLYGQVASYYEKQLAQAAVKQIDASCPVTNQLEVACSRIGRP